jgi:hypothetical protein
MEIKDLVDILRELSKDYEKEEMFLPSEVVDIINGKEQEKSWEKISIGKVMYYIADMLEK